MDNGYHSPQVWEVIGGADKGGVIVRVDEEICSTPFPDRLTTGSLVMEVELVGDRLCYDRIAGTGAGPDSGWVSVRLGLKELLVPIDVKPPRSGWRVVHKDLPTWVPPRPRPERPAITDGSQGPSQWRDEDEMVGAGPGSAVGPEYAQISGQPFAYYHKVCFSDTKPTGLRMSACLGTMEECRADTFTLCDQTVDSFKKVTDPFILVALELHPAIADFSPSKSEDGLLYAHPSSKGPIMTWLRNEVQFGWPMFPLRTEEQIIYAVGKNPRSSERRAIATGRFIEALVDEQTDGMLQGLKWQEDMDRFFAALKSNHSNPRLDEAKLHNLYRSSGKPFKPNIMTKVSWTMGNAFADLWAILYHAKTPELLFEVNQLCGGAFAELVKEECDPQAIAESLPSKMQVGAVYDCFCYLEEASKKAAYVLLPTGSATPSDCVLCVVALYDWSSVPADGSTLTSEDVELPNSGAARGNLVKYALGGETKPTKLLDLGFVKPLS